MNKPFDSGPVRLGCYPLSRLDVNGMKSLLSALEVKADGIYNAVSTGQRIRDGSLVVNVGLYGLKLRIIRTNCLCPRSAGCLDAIRTGNSR